MNSMIMKNFIKRKMVVNLTVALSIIISQIIVVNPSMTESSLSKSALLESKGLFPVFNPNQVDYAIRDTAKKNISISFKSGKDVKTSDIIYYLCNWDFPRLLCHPYLNQYT